MPVQLRWGGQPKPGRSAHFLEVRLFEQLQFPDAGLAERVAASQGFVGDVSSAGIQHDAAIGPAFQGGPIVNSDGKVVAIASRSYAPLGFGTDGVWFGVPGQAVCEKILKCPNGSPSGAGQQR